MPQPSISVDVKFTRLNFQVVVVKGEGFKANETIHLTHRSLQLGHLSDPNTYSFAVDEAGEFSDEFYASPCEATVETRHFWYAKGDLSGASNSVTTTCP
ncbi:hypothetical protein [Streptomyces sp. NPDC046332]|uniref:hypothetical protein n=1 Tax=unclassified Streptomyces TaxID=2593676 RepID=UPI0033E7F724